MNTEVWQPNPGKDAVEAIKDTAQQNTYPYGDMLGILLADKYKGQPCVILGNGPSAKSFDRAQHKDAVVIACNGALVLCPDADIWLVCEGGAHIQPWFWEHKDFAGIPCWDRYIGHCAERLLAEYGQDFVSRVVWNMRGLMHPQDFSIRRSADGLAHVEVADHAGRDHSAGTVVMQAIHLAGILGCCSVDLYGAELYFPDGEQHADGWSPYTDGDSITNAVNFDIDGGRVTISPEGKLRSTRLFLAGAAAIRGLLRRIGSELPVTDHSKGLLSWEGMKDENEVERPEDSPGSEAGGNQNPPGRRRANRK